MSPITAIASGNGTFDEYTMANHHLATIPAGETWVPGCVAMHNFNATVAIVNCTASWICH